MRQQLGKTAQTRFETAKEAVKQLVEQKLLGAPSHEIGLVTFGTEETDNNLNDSDSKNFKNVVSARVPEKATLEFLRSIEEFQPA
jgi:hypothetical protein